MNVHPRRGESVSYIHRMHRLCLLCWCGQFILRYPVWISGCVKDDGDQKLETFLVSQVQTCILLRFKIHIQDGSTV